MAELAFQLKTHLYNMLTNNLTWEYLDQIEKWKLYIENISDMAQKVSESEVDTLKAADAEIQAAKEAAFAQAMFIFNLFAVPAVSFLGAAIKLKWAPKFTATSRMVVDRKLVLLNNRYLSGFSSSSTTVTTQNLILNQVLGEIGKSVAGFVVDLTQKSLRTAPDPFKPPDTKFVQNSNDWQSFRTGLMTTLYEQQQVGLAQIRGIANAVENDAIAVGQGIVARLDKERPDLKHLKGANADSALYQAGADMINKLLNANRTKWAADWFYYGNDPPQVKSNLQILMEREIWALWLLQNVWEMDYFKSIYLSDPGTGHTRPVFETPDNDWYVTTKAVLSRLRYLAVPLSPTTWQALAPIDTKLHEGIKEIEDSKDISSGSAQELLNTGLGDVLSWAKTHIPELGPLDFGVPRTKLTSIELYTGQFPGGYQH